MRLWCLGSLVLAALLAAGHGLGQESRRDGERPSAEAARPTDERSADSTKEGQSGKGQGDRPAEGPRRDRPDTPGGNAVPRTPEQPGARPADRPRGPAFPVPPNSRGGDLGRRGGGPVPQGEQPRGEGHGFPGGVVVPRGLLPEEGPGQAGAFGNSAYGLPPPGIGVPGAIGPPIGPPGYRREENGVAFLQRIDPELHRLYQADFECERQCQLLAARIREAPKKDRELLVKELTDLVHKHFQIRQERRRLMLRLLEEELARTREAIEAREAARDELVQRRIQDLTGEQPMLDF